MAVLQSRLDQLEMARQAQMNAQHTQSLTEISWGNQIRTYVLHVCLFTFDFTFIAMVYIVVITFLYHACSLIAWSKIFGQIMRFQILILCLKGILMTSF